MKNSYEYNRDFILNITPSMAYKCESIEEWKKTAREKLSELLGMDKFTKVPPEVDIEYTEQKDGFTETRFTFQSEAGYRVPCHLLIPDEVEKPPVMICLQGHSNGMHISLGTPKFEGDEVSISGGDRDFCVRAVKEGYASIAMEQRNFGELSVFESKPRCQRPAMNALLIGRTTIGERVWDTSRLIDVLETGFSDKVDVHNICCMGNSGGGTATAYIAALEDRVVLAMPSCAMATFKDSIVSIEHCVCNYVPNIVNYFDMGDLIAMSYPKFYIQVSGKEDNIFPISAAEEAFEKGKSAYKKEGREDRCTLIKGNGGHRFYADDAWPFVHKYIGR